MRSIFVIVASLAATVYGKSLRDRRNIEDYCLRHESLYSRYCGGSLGAFDTATQSKLSRFCPEYESNCQSKDSLIPLSLVVPPALPKSNYNNFDLPLGHEVKKNRIHSTAATPNKALEGLTPEIVATCTPDCTEIQCTTTCKCAYTHPRVHSMCNPPSSAEMVDTCNKWYSKCTMFQPIAYD